MSVAFSMDPDSGLPTGDLPTNVAAPITIGLSAHASETAAAWALITNTGHLTTGAITPRRRGTEGAALLAGIEHLLTDPQFRGRPITVVCASEAFATQVAPTLTALAPNVHLTHQHAHARWLTQVAYRHARTTAEPNPQQPPPNMPRKWAKKAPLTTSTCLHTTDGRILAATDGSVGNWKGLKVSGYGWAINKDWHGTGHLEGTDILHAELRAVHALFNNTPADTRLHVLIDSQPALAVLESMRTTPTLTSVTGITLTAATNAWIAALRRQVRYRDVTFAWIKGHTGNPLNETADRIAVQARRHAQGMTDKPAFNTILANIVTDLDHAIKQSSQPTAAQWSGGR